MARAAPGQPPPPEDTATKYSRVKPEDPARLRHNPFAPNVAQWPVTSPSGPEVPNIPQTTAANFLATVLSESGALPPDSMGAVGPSQVLVIVNNRIKVFSKTGVLGALNATTDDFFSSVLSASTSDPHVRYDRLTQRWFITMIDIANTGNRVLIAVSSGPTITGASSFAFYQFQQDLVGATPNSDTGHFADYDMLGVDRFALYIGANIFGNSSGGGVIGTTGFVVNKSNLLSGTLTVTAFRQLGAVGGTGDGPWSPQGVDNDDPNATEGYFIGVDRNLSGVLYIRRISDPGGGPSVSDNLTVTTPSTSAPIPQAHKGDTLNKKLDSLGTRLFAAAMHRDKITGTNSLWTAHNIQVDNTGVAVGSGGRNGSRWYQIGEMTNTPALIQSGTLFDSATNARGFWIPSVAASGQGHMALGCSYAGSNDFPGIAVAGRLRTDPMGTIQAPTLAVITTTSYNVSETANPHRWGDYSQTVVDPTDDMTLWTFQEYCNFRSSWGVRAIQLRSLPPAIPITASLGTLTAGQTNVDVQITGLSVSGSEFFDPGPDTGGPGFANHIAAFVSSDVTVNGVTFIGPTNITVNLTVASNALAGGRSLTVTNPDSQKTNSAAGLITILAPPVVTASPTNHTVGRGSNTTFSLTVVGTDPLSYQWRFNSFEIQGATNSILTLASPQCADAGGYDVVVTNYLGSATSSVAFLTVDAPITISIQPSNQVVALNQSFLLMVSATNDCGGLSYRWQLQGTNLPGASAASYSVTNAQVSNSGPYTVVVSNLAGAVTSSVATVIVISPPAVDFNGAPLAGPAPLTVFFTNLTTGAASFSWTFGDGGASTSFSPMNTYSNVGSYTVSLVAVGPGGTTSLVKTNLIAVIPFTPPTILLGPLDGANFIFSFATVPGKTYITQSRSSLTDASWLSIQTNAGDGSVQFVTNSIAGSSQNFYRLSVQ